MKFIPRTTAPTKNNKCYYSNNNRYYLNGYGLPNCTCYAYGRILELIGYIPNGLHYGNAENWYPNTKSLEKGQTPKLGSIICFKGNKGHVAVVEKIYEDGSIDISNSAYKGTLFYMKHLKNNYKYNDKYKFQGFIYLPIEFENDTPKISFKTGQIVRLSESATEYQGSSKGIKIPNNYKNKTYTILQVSKDGQTILLRELYSWVLASECSIVEQKKEVKYKVNALLGLWMLNSNGKKVKVYRKGTIVTYLGYGYSKYGYTYYKVKIDSTNQVGFMASKFLKKQD